ncbi:MAG: immunoglobulin domain-containing protein, partial [Desulfobacterales bacterium]|nr:immunoglobulin domain-containing protein [Desulfobacterales bacterium]
RADETIITGPTTPEWTLPSVSLEDHNATIECVVSNLLDGENGQEGGSVTSSPATLTVHLAAPVIKAQPVSNPAAVNEEDSVTFTIKAFGSHLSFEWFKGESLLTGETTTSTDEAKVTTSKITISKADYSDDGAKITCVVKNAWNGQSHSLTSEPVTMDVVLMPPTITKQPADQKDVDELTSASFGVRASGSLLTYQWYRGGELLTGETSPSLTISNLMYDVHHNTRYHCVVSNKAGEEGGKVTTREALLTVRRVKPVITKHPVGGSFDEGDELVLTILATGSDLHYQWFKDGSAISEAKSQTFAIASLVYEDRGTYQCKVSNSLYSVESEPAVVDVTPAVKPSLDLKIPGNMETTDTLLSFSGVASSPNLPIEKIEATNSRFPGQIFGLIYGEHGTITGEIPLAIGENVITVTMFLENGSTVVKVATVHSVLSAVPVIHINAPASGSTVAKDEITLEGSLRSSLSPEKIRLMFNGEVYFPEGQDGQYSFAISHVRLVAGVNTLTVTAETPYGNSSAQTIVNYDDGSGVVTEDPPEITITAPGNGAWLEDRSVVVKGVVKASTNVLWVTVNGSSAMLTGSGTSVSFEQTITAEEGASKLEVIVVAQDASGVSSDFALTVHFDDGAPEITITSEALSGCTGTCSVAASPFHLTGTIKEANLASVSLNANPVTVLPSGKDLWSFDIPLSLIRNEDHGVVLRASDFAGNQTLYGVTLRFDASIAIEIISPDLSTPVVVSKATTSLEVKASLPGIAQGDTVSAILDGGPPHPLTVDGDEATATLSINPDTFASGAHTLSVSCFTAGGDLISSREVTFKAKNLEALPLKVVRQEPENGENRAEPNAFIAFYFNKAVDSAAISVEVLETAHGLTWDTSRKGEDITTMSRVEPITVHRERESVEGGISHFPENTMIAFYPARDFAYGSTIYCRVLQTKEGEKEEVHRSLFEVRSMPTLVEGFVADQFMKPLKGVTVQLEEEGLSTQTNADGYFGFGYGLSPEKNLPGGAHTLIVNPGLSNRHIGTLTQTVSLEKGLLNTLEMVRVPLLDPATPFAALLEGQSNHYQHQKLMLDLGNAQVTWPEGIDHESIHVQFMPLSQIPDHTLELVQPHWVYAIQPRGITCTGSVNVSMAIPEFSGSHEYLKELGSRVLLLGYDPGAKTIVPVGVGKIDSGARRIVSEGICHLKSLDYIGYCPVPVNLQPFLKDVVSGLVTMPELIGVIESAK